MDRSLRYLRIAFSATCLIVCVLLVALWVRSYWWLDFVRIPLTVSRGVCGSSFNGQLSIGMLNESSNPRAWSDYCLPFEKFDPKAVRHLSGRFSLENPLIWFPHWFLVALTIPGTLLARPWTIRRFSLRTLLIAMTLVAVVLGLIVWAAR
jgi:hypothetical protein